MIITLSPLRSDETLALSRQGDVLSVNGETFDFSDLPEGARLPREAVACAWLASDVTREQGRLCLTLTLPHGPDASEAARFPTPLCVIADGVISLPHSSPVKDIQ